MFSLAPDTTWRQAVEDTWDNIKEEIIVNLDEECSTHVHMSIPGNYSVAQLRRIAQAVIHFEPAFEAIMPEDCRGNEFAASNWIDNRYLKRLSRQQAINQIEQCRMDQELIRLMHPGGQEDRYYGWNFEALNKLGTVEFRRGAGSREARHVLQWVELATTFLRASIMSPSKEAITHIPADVGGLLHFLRQGHHDYPGVGDSRLYAPLFRGVSPSSRQDPKPVRHLDGERLKKFQRKVAFGNAHNYMAQTVASAKLYRVI